MHHENRPALRRAFPRQGLDCDCQTGQDGSNPRRQATCKTQSLLSSAVNCDDAKPFPNHWLLAQI